MGASAAFRGAYMRIAKSLVRPAAWAWAVFPILILLALFGFADKGQAAGTSIGKPWLFGSGIACDASLLPWPSVWFGHFSGGLASYQRGAPQAEVVWKDEKLCFPSQRECMAWQRAERRAFHEIHGYWTCLRIR